MALEALAASGLEKGQPRRTKRALVFLSRCQNRSESNDMQVATDAGVVVGGRRRRRRLRARELEGRDNRSPGRPEGRALVRLDELRAPEELRLRGPPKDDPRMKACWEWLKKHYTLDVNPGFEALRDPSAPYQGLFYYFHTMAKALDLYGEETIVDPRGSRTPGGRSSAAGSPACSRRWTDRGRTRTRRAGGSRTPSSRRPTRWSRSTRRCRGRNTVARLVLPRSAPRRCERSTLTRRRRN
jgi:hypothetical protein